MKKHKTRQQEKQSFPAWVWAILIMVAVAVVGFIVYQQMSAAQAVYPDEMTVAQAAEKRDQGAFFLDVRQPEEWQQLHIPGATLIPLGELPERLNEVPKDRGVVVVCRSGNRSKQGRDILRSAGFTQVTSMAGGVVQWQAQGLPIE